MQGKILIVDPIATNRIVLKVKLVTAFYEVVQATTMSEALDLARTQVPDSANSQFFICLDDAHFLDGQYTVWGQVESGMEHVHSLPKGEPPREPGTIVKATVA